MKAKWIHKIETSSHCNLKCPYCPHSKGLVYGNGHMSKETFNRVVYWTKILNPIGQPNDEEFVWLHGIGEPLLNPDLFYFIRHLSKYVKVGLSTNGVLLTPKIIEGLNYTGLSHLTISQHDQQATAKALKILKEVDMTQRFTLDIQSTFNDDWAGQISKINVPNKNKTFFQCAHIEKGGVHVLWNGNIVNCCVDAQSYPILGSVYDEEIRDIDIKIIPLCKTCRSGKSVIQKELRAYSNSLTQEEKTELLWERVERDTNYRHMPDYFTYGMEQ